MNVNPETGEPKWSPRVQMGKIRRLYQNDANGVVDEELLDDVGITLYCRCESILVASDAAIGKIHCPSCANVISRRSIPKAVSLQKREKVVCSKCGWEVEWLAYQKTYQHKDLWGLSFAGAMREFMDRWKKAPAAREKMLLIDRLIHLWHHQFSNERAPTRPAAPTFIEGGRKEVVRFLDELSEAHSALRSPRVGAAANEVERARVKSER